MGSSYPVTLAEVGGRDRRNKRQVLAGAGTPRPAALSESIEVKSTGEGRHHEMDSARERKCLLRKG